MDGGFTLFRQGRLIEQTILRSVHYFELPTNRSSIQRQLESSICLHPGDKASIGHQKYENYFRQGIKSGDLRAKTSWHLFAMQFVWWI
jgi:hypothetical protein